MSFLSPLRKSRVVSIVATAIATLFAAQMVRAAANDVYETVSAGSRIAFSVTSDGNPAPTFQWMKDGVNIPGATGSTLEIPVASTAHQGVYNVVASNSAGWALSHDLILTVKPTVSGIAPSFTLQPYPSASAPAGSSLTLSAEAVGTPAPVYQWRFNGTPIAGATQSSLIFLSLSTSDSGNYSVVATNAAGSATSNNSILKVSAPAPQTTPPPEVQAPVIQPPVIEPPVVQPPVFSLHPASQTGKLKGSVSFKAYASGEPTYQWYKDGQAIPGATSSGYVIAVITSSDAGTYTVIATNSAGSETSNPAVLTTVVR